MSMRIPASGFDPVGCLLVFVGVAILVAICWATESPTVRVFMGLLELVLLAAYVFHRDGLI